MSAYPLIALTVLIAPIIWSARQPSDWDLSKDARKKRRELENTMRRIRQRNHR